MTLKGVVGLFTASRSEDGEDAHNKSTRPLLNWRGGKWNQQAQSSYCSFKFTFHDHSRLVLVLLV
jgi:hypothetical protein